MADDLQQLTLETGEICWRELGAGPPLILLHGWSMSHAVFGELADLLAKKYRLLIPDLPGHGGSAPTTPCSLGRFADILESWLARLELSQPYLLGWSLGGQLALQLAYNAPGSFLKLILVSTTPRFCAGDDWTAGLPSGELSALRRGIQRRYLATMGEFFDLQFKGESLSAERRREILQFAVRPGGLPAPEAALKTLDLLGQEDLRPLLRGITLPTLVIHGDQDQIIPYAAGCFLAGNLADATLQTCVGTGHAPFLSDPKTIARRLIDFCV